ncbi:hypothetical protein B5J94_05220 [Moraxella lacunata]|uniref:Uncharacterized protein n=1 Tax=Moraxella lacunata TaxID=477 RepID=A0A1V4GZK7_MORLA|nr:hypothetical protein [Moraxella lacunata]OPH37761.1 hypothetical protein B5J94_05220 [Moraxella lacunata]
MPLKQDLHYITGKVRLVTVAKDGKNREIKHMSIVNPQTKERLIIACGNAVIPKKDIGSNCVFREGHLDEILTIGYYYQPPVLGITNEIPQMATIHINKPNGEMIVADSYAYTKDKISSANRFFVILGLVVLILLIWSDIRNARKKLSNKE